MGQIHISAWGSFRSVEKTFSAMKYGHANAVAEAIQYLSEHVLPEAIANDHKCQADGSLPEKGFDKNK